MNKNLRLFSLLFLILFSVLLTACGKPKKFGNVAIIDKARNMTVEELAEKAKAETGNFIVYSTSSKTDKTVKAFFEKYGLQGEAKGVKQSEKDYYAAIEKLINGRSTDIDALVTQNGASLSAQILAGNAITYIPGQPTVAPGEMYAFMYYFKEFAMDKKFTDINIQNVWDLTDTTADVYYKKSGEPINQLFMAELTTEKWANKLAAAYDKKFGEGTCATAIKDGNFKNAGYLFLDKFLNRVIDYESEGKIANNVVVGADRATIGFSPVTKYSVGEEGTFNKVKFFNRMDGFNGYAYKFYAEISKTTDRPYTAMLFVNYLSTAEGVANYQTGERVYSSNISVQKDINELLEGMVIENYDNVKKEWPSIVRLLESYVK